MTLQLFSQRRPYLFTTPQLQSTQLLERLLRRKPQISTSPVAVGGTARSTGARGGGSHGSSNVAIGQKAVKKGATGQGEYRKDSTDRRSLMTQALFQVRFCVCMSVCKQMSGMYRTFIQFLKSSRLSTLTFKRQEAHPELFMSKRNASKKQNRRFSNTRVHNTMHRVAKCRVIYAIYMSIYIYIYIYIYIHMHMYIYAYDLFSTGGRGGRDRPRRPRCIYIYVCVEIYVYIYVCVNIRVHFFFRWLRRSTLGAWLPPSGVKRGAKKGSKRDCYNLLPICKRQAQPHWYKHI